MSGSHRTDTISSSLLVGVRTFRADAWSRLLHIYGPLVFHWCTRSGLGVQDAEDLGQEVFRAVASRIGGFERKTSKDTFGGWLRTITRHKVADYWRKKSREPATFDAAESIESYGQQEIANTPDPSAGVSSDDLQALDESTSHDGFIYQRALTLIRSEFRETSWKAFWATAIDGRATADVAADLNMSPMAVRKAKSRVLRRLREEFAGLEKT